MPLRPCLGTPGHPCRHLTPTARCPACTALAGRPTYTHQWAKHARVLIAQYRATHGDTCPGWAIPPHDINPNTWTVDHHVGPLCRSCNSRKGATVDKQHIQHG